MICQTLKHMALLAVAGVIGIASAAQAAVEVDLSTPKATLTTMAKGMEQGDKEAVRAAVTGDEKQMRAVDMMVDLVNATRTMQSAAKEKFGQIPDDQAEQMAKLPGKIEQADVDIDGEDATVTMPKEARDVDGTPVPAAPGEKGEQIRLKKVGNDWKVDVMDLSRGQQLSDQQLEAGKTMVKAAEDIAREIKDDKYQTYREAMQAYEGKMMAAMMQAMPEARQDFEGQAPEQPATQPAQPQEAE